jgi:hypothetical protein
MFGVVQRRLKQDWVPLVFGGAVSFALKGFCSEALKAAALKLGTPEWLAYFLIFLGAALLSEVGWQSILLSKKRSFTAEEREFDNFKRQFKAHLLKSHTLDFLLLSGHTMFYDAKEIFIMKCLKEMGTSLRERPFRVLLLNPRCRAFHARAKMFIRSAEAELDPGRPDNEEVYFRRCKEIIEKFRTLGAVVRFYQIDSVFRLHLFEDTVFVSFYGQATGGHLTMGYRFDKEDETSIYFGFKKYFDSIWRRASENMDTDMSKRRLASPFISDDGDVK